MATTSPTPADTRVPGPRRWLFALTTVLLVTAAGLGVFEVGLRLLRPDLHPESGNVLRSCHEFDPHTGWRPAAACAGRFVQEDFDSTLSTNGYGLRGRETAHTLAPGTRRVAVLGDSYAWGYGVNDEETFAVHLEHRLPETEVLNFGVCGYGTDQAYLRYTEVARPFAPQVVVLAFFAGNDFADNTAGRTKPTFRPYFAFASDGVLRPANLPLPVRTQVLGARVLGFDEVAQRWSFAYRYLYLKAKLLSGLLKQSPAIARLRAGRRQRNLEAAGQRRALPLHTADPPPEAADAIAVTLGLLDLLHQAVAADGAELLVLLIPQRAEVDAAEWARELRRRNLDPGAHDSGRPHALIAEWAAARGVGVVNLFDAFAADPRAREYYLRANRHFSVAGHQRCAELVLPSVREALARAARAHS